MRAVSTLLALLAGFAAPALAAEGALDDSQRHCRQLFVQFCGICHLKPNLTAERYAPALNCATVEGKEEGVRALIAGGSQRMPGFQYPYHAAIDRHHQVWVNMMNSDQVMRYDPASGKFTFFDLPTLGAEARYVSLLERDGRLEVVIPEFRPMKIAVMSFRRAKEIEGK